MATKKAIFITQAVGAATRLAQAAEDILTLRNTYFDRGYNGGGTSPIVDGDVPAEVAGLTAAQIGSFINLANQLDNLLNNAVTTQSDWDGVLNQVRGDV